MDDFQKLTQTEANRISSYGYMWSFIGGMIFLIMAGLIVYGMGGGTLGLRVAIGAGGVRT